MTVIDHQISQLESQLRESGTPDRSELERRYLKSDLEHWGVRVPDIRRIARRFLGDAVETSHDELVDLIEAIWARPVHEMRMAAVEIACHRVSSLEPADVALIERMLRESKTWALVDALAVHGAGPLLSRHPDEDPILDRWAADDDFWIRRSALLTHLGPLRAGDGDWPRFTRYADSMLEEKEFFIRKAIGWILRDTARRRPDMVYDWILPRAHRASGVTIREVVKRLSAEQAEEVMNRYRG